MHAYSDSSLCIVSTMVTAPIEAHGEPLLLPYQGLITVEGFDNDNSIFLHLTDLESAFYYLLDGNVQS